MVNRNRTTNHPDDKIIMIKMLESLHGKYGSNEKELRNFRKKNQKEILELKNYNLQIKM